MQVNNVNNTTSFTSRNNPIPAETFISALGKITMSEASDKDITPVAKLLRRRELDSYKLLNFYGEGKEEAKEFLKKINRNSWLRDIKAYLIKLLEKPDGNSSLLVAKNEDNKVIGFATMQSLDGVKEKVGIIDNIYLDFKYSKGNLGQYLLYKITKSGQGQFSHTVTKSPYIGDSVYQDIGYKPIPTSAHILDIIAKDENKQTQNWMYKKIDYYS